MRNIVLFIFTMSCTFTFLFTEKAAGESLFPTERNAYPSAGEVNNLKGDIGTANNLLLISNESTDIKDYQTIETFQLNKKEQENKIQEDKVYRKDIKKPFVIPSDKNKLIQKNNTLFATSYKLGDSRYFWATDFVSNSDYQLKARLAYQGTKVDVWINNNQLTDSDAAKLGEEFERRIYPSVSKNFAVESDVNNDRKINILCFDIQDGFNGTGGYVGGYFWNGDLYNVSGSNRSEILYVDTYPSMATATGVKIEEVYPTLAHEFQHLVNYNHNVLIEGKDPMDTWMDEALSMAAEQIYSGKALNDRIDYYNQSTSIMNGHSLLYWDYYGDTLSNYSLSYLFGQYLKLQANQGNTIFKEIIADRNSNYIAVENIFRKYSNTKMTFGEIMTSFRLALQVNDDSGLYGFKGNMDFAELKQRVFQANGVNLRGGGAVVTDSYSPGELIKNIDEDSNLSYTVLTNNAGTLSVDIEAPIITEVWKVSDRDDSVTGTSEANAMIIVKKQDEEIGRGVAGIDGGFAVSIPKQNAGHQLQIIAVDLSGNRSEPKIVEVLDKTPPLDPIVNRVTNKTLLITGTGEPESNIEVHVTGESVGQTTVQDDKNFRILLDSPIKAGEELEITATDSAGNKSDTVKMTVENEPVLGWVKENGHWLYIDSLTGTKVIGWLLDNQKWYYLAANGEMQTGWIVVSGKWYFLSSSGAMQTGWHLYNSDWYYMDKSGSMKTGWVLIGKTWYYFDSKGSMRTGWLKTGVHWYYLKRSGDMSIGWSLINGQWYYFHPNGQMAASTVIDGYELGSDGSWMRS